MCTGPSIQSNVTHVRGVKSNVCSCIQSNVTHVRVVKSSVYSYIQSNVLMSDVRDSKYTISAYDIFAYNFLNIQPIFNPKKFWKAET